MRGLILAGDTADMASPTARRRRVGAELRRLRTEAGLTQDQAAERAELTTDQLRRIENARAKRLPIHQVRALLDIYGAEAGVRTELEQWTKEARSTKGWWTGYRGVITDRFAGLEDAASVIREFNCQTVPGLVQTDDYARAVFTGGQPKATAAEIDRRVAARMKRAEIMDRPSPPDLWAVVDEAVLRRVIGSEAIMAAQLERLAAFARRPGVTIQVLPFGAGAHAGIDGSFLVFEFPDQDLPVGVAEGPMGTVYIEDADDVERCLYAHNQMCAQSLPPADSLRLIEECREALI